MNPRSLATPSLVAMAFALGAPLVHAGKSPPAHAAAVPSPPVEARFREESEADERVRCARSVAAPLVGCDSIGPLVIPRAPSREFEGQDAYDAWQAALTPLQRQYIDTTCADDRNRYTPLCGHAMPAGPVEDDDGETLDYATWFKRLPAIDRRWVEATCAATVEPMAACGGIGPLQIPDPREFEARAEWRAQLSRPQRAYVKAQCAEPMNAYSTLCGKQPPIRPEDGQRYTTWLESLGSTDRAWVDRECRSTYARDSSELCDGIGPLSIPVPPSQMVTRRTAAGPKPLTRAQWFASLSVTQRSYVDEQCAIPSSEDDEGSELCGVLTPLVIAFAPVVPVRYVDGPAVAFAWGALGPQATAWPTMDTPWLVRDLDGNGAIDGAHELFGSATVLADGAMAPHGFAALAPLDANRDGVIDARDPGFAQLALWRDANADRTSAPSELTPAARELQSLSLAYDVVPRCDGLGNCERERATIRYLGSDGTVRTGAVIDLWLRPTE